MSYNEHSDLLNTLSDCLAACEYCADACLSEENPKEMAECIRLDRDCADICAMAIRYIARDSRRASAVIKLCSQICDQCAEECENHDHEHCQKCAEACRECADACRNYKGSGVHA